jgi:hypothetical protein
LNMENENSENSNKTDKGIDAEELDKLFKKIKLDKYQFCPYCQSAVEYLGAWSLPVSKMQKCCNKLLRRELNSEIAK